LRFVFLPGAIFDWFVGELPVRGFSVGVELRCCTDAIATSGSKTNQRAFDTASEDFEKNGGLTWRGTSSIQFALKSCRTRLNESQEEKQNFL
jgi:hypothetical protein